MSTLHIERIFRINYDYDLACISKLFKLILDQKIVYIQGAVSILLHAFQWNISA